MRTLSLPATKAVILAAFDTLPDAVMIEVLRVGAERFSGYRLGYDQLDAGLDSLAEEIREDDRRGPIGNMLTPMSDGSGVWL
ncbi:MAG: hypothetical protein ABS87_00880 [Sphingomonas sp. SCN 67-18]|uniref:hypothetical protein n=1 Tax=uncultured Sphingomonas sp. TaxID=158754 RepID=UPI00086EAB03|nr:hypothetical protein [Sphingomonas sp. SCN 67-18]ODU22752.1 MAG: hypothetical protein ABS87_00880 [Sphingomonas sp. SCN 67-18]